MIQGFPSSSGQTYETVDLGKDTVALVARNTRQARDAMSDMIGLTQAVKGRAAVLAVGGAEVQDGDMVIFILHDNASARFNEVPVIVPGDDNIILWGLSPEEDHSERYTAVEYVTALSGATPRFNRNDTAVAVALANAAALRPGDEKINAPAGAPRLN